MRQYLRLVRTRCADGSPALPVHDAIAAYRERLRHDWECEDFASSLIGMQIVLEGVARKLLCNLDLTLAREGERFAPYRRLLLAQEDIHHAFGVRTLSQMVACGAASGESLRRVASEYLELSGGLLGSCRDLFDYFGADRSEYLATPLEFLDCAGA